MNGIEISIEGDVRVLTFGPEYQTIGTELIGPLSDFFSETAKTPPYKIVLHMPFTTFFGSSFLECVLRLWNRLKPVQGRLAVAGLSPHCMDVMCVARLNQLWLVTDTLAEALTGLAS